MPITVPRRRLLLAFLATPPAATRGWARTNARSLAEAPIAVAGDWGRSLPGAALIVLQRMRAASLAGVPLLSPRQPERIRVENHLSGPPHIWLHFDDNPEARIVVDIGERDWSKLAYQFGHELGHVLANSWGRDSKPAPGSQWLEEALVETFAHLYLYCANPLASLRDYLEKRSEERRVGKECA